MSGISPSLKLLKFGTSSTSAPIRVSTKSRKITLSSDSLETLGVVVNDFLLVATLGKEIYLAKRPKGCFEGTKIKATSAERGKPSFYLQGISIVNLVPGDYKLAERIKDEYKEPHQVSPSPITWFHLSRVN